jgi:pSer/pThr/pTyr-binding forkhead associated (FHA) protein
VLDLASCNGTYLNGRIIDHGRIRRGDALQLGETVLRAR